MTGGPGGSTRPTHRKDRSLGNPVRRRGSYLYAALRPEYNRAGPQRTVAAGASESCLERIEPHGGLLFSAGRHRACPRPGTPRSRDSAGQRHDLSLVRLEPPRPRWPARASSTSNPHRGNSLRMRSDRRAATRSRPTTLASSSWSCDQFVLDRWRFSGRQQAGGDSRCHILAVLEGTVRVRPRFRPQPVEHGGVVLLPADWEKLTSWLATTP